jgi:hypothetical protein
MWEADQCDFQTLCLLIKGLLGPVTTCTFRSYYINDGMLNGYSTDSYLCCGLLRSTLELGTGSRIIKSVQLNPGYPYIP